METSFFFFFARLIDNEETWKYTNEKGMVSVALEFMNNADFKKYLMT